MGALQPARGPRTRGAWLALGAGMQTKTPLHSFAAALLALSVMACGGDDDAADDNVCDPLCSANLCMVCDISGSAPTCVSACGPDLTCEDGTCMAPEETTCEPVCDDCEACDTSGGAPECVALCAEGLTCDSGVCQAPEVPACEPACGDCEVCDTTGEEPLCVSLCAEGTTCVEGVCEPPDPAACSPACGGCEVCDTSGAEPTCVFTCGDEETCATDTCVRAGMHSAFLGLQGPFADGPSVTAACLDCHADQGEHFKDTAHWNWAGATPGLEGHEADTTIGKVNLVNNFCIAIRTNEKRCSQCHAGYGMADDTFDFSNAGNIDCLVCHADPRAGYAKAPKTAGAPDPAADLVLAAQSVGIPERANCGSCHFGAGGGDNVKKGDMGSALAHPTIETDAHMGRGMSCNDCHAGASHTLLGQGVHLPVSEGRTACTDCHTASPHATSVYNEHALDIACQTCHIPAFSRQQATKMNWDWSTSGNRTIGTDGVETGTLADGTVVTVYDAMKGTFVWEKNVAPVHAWYDGRTTRMTVLDTFGSGEGASAGNPVMLGMPLATKADAEAKIFPFKVMRGQQPIDPTRLYVIVPKLFGPGGFWAGIPAAGDYSAAAVKTLWTAALTAGALATGQLGTGESYGEDDWSWGYTEMYMGINHEVAPKSQALGATGCTGQCHGGTALDWTALGYSCDPMTGGGATCGSRHY